MELYSPLETKVAGPATQDDVLAAFDAFKDANDERLAQLEKRMSADVVTIEKVDRISRAIDELTLKSRRPQLSAEHRAEPSEHKKAFDGYVRKGETSGLFDIEQKAMSISSNPDGGYLVPQETEAEIGRLLSKASPMRMIADVRQVSSVRARVVLLNRAVVQPDMSLDEAARASAWRIGPKQYDHGHGTYVPLALAPVVKALRPLAPVRLTALSDGTGVTLAWIRQTRWGGDSWDLAEVPLAEDAEAYQLDILNGNTVLRSISLSAPTYHYTTALMTADLGAPPTQFTARVAQRSTTHGLGPTLERTINV
jgi:hypothetical protein